MMSFRATFMFSIVFALLGCSNALHYTYPPPSPHLDMSQAEEIQFIEQPLPDSDEPRIQEEPQETIHETPQEVDKTSPAKVSSKKTLRHERDYDVNSQVQSWIDRLTGKDKKYFQSSLTRFDKIRPVMEEIFERTGVPKDLVYLCLVESGANPHAVSCTGATGYWQFIPDTAKKYGLQVNRYVDERKHLEKSTQAAALYLKNLYSIFGDWLLAIAAYNAGEGAVTRLMKNNKDVYTFWDINHSMAIKPETIDYVPKYIATVIMAKNRAAYGLPKAEGGKTQRIPKTVDDAKHLDDMAIVSGDLNSVLAQTGPAITTNGISNGIRGKVQKNRSSKVNIVEDLISYKVRRGDTLYSLAKRHSTTVEAIARVNKISPARGLKVGKVIVIPSQSKADSEMTNSKKDQTHMVAKGDTLEGIAREHGVSVAEITRMNQVKDPRHIKPKTVLAIPAKKSSHTLAKAKQYRVKKGDTIWGISRQFDVSAMELRRWNRLNSTAQIKPGDELTIYLQ